MRPKQGINLRYDSKLCTIKVTLCPSGESESIETRDYQGDGRNPTWETSTHGLWLQYTGRPPAGLEPFLRFEVLNEKSESLGNMEYSLREHLMPENDGREIAVAGVLQDKHGNNSGVVEAYLKFLPGVSAESALAGRARISKQLGLPAEKQLGLKSRLVLATPGVVRVRAVEAFNLAGEAHKSPLVRFTLLPWGDTKLTGRCVDGKQNPVWDAHKHKAIVDLQYRGTPPKGVIPTLRIEIFDHGAMSKDTLIACAEHSLLEIFEKRGETLSAQVPLLTPVDETSAQQRKSAGIIVIHFGFCGGVLGGTPSTNPLPLFSENELLGYSLGGFRGTIRIRPVRAFGLKKVQRFGEQDPYVKCTLLQTRKHLKTKYVNNGGQNCSWDPVQHNSVLDFDYDGMLASVGFKVEVLDAETIAADRLIGKNDDFIVNLPDAKSISKEHTVLLKDKKGNDAGRVTLEVFFESKEVSSSHYASGAASNPLVTADPDLKTGATLTVQPIKGMDLKSVQRFGKQDPYCKVILQWNGVHQKTKYHNNGGKSPVWDEKEHDSKLSFATKLLPLDSKLTIEVYDAETIMPDRIIGTGALDLSARLPNLQRNTS